MRLWRLEFGIVTDGQGKPIKLENKIYRLEYEYGHCGCHIYTFGKLYLTWLGDECYFETLREESNESSKKR